VEVGEDWTRLTAPRAVWDRMVTPGLRGYFATEAVLDTAINMLQDMCQQELEIVLTESDRPDNEREDHDVDDMIEVVMSNRRVVRERLVELSRGRLSNDELRAIMKTESFTEACTNVPRDGGL
jgi:hypothetical protein